MNMFWFHLCLLFQIVCYHMVLADNDETCVTPDQHKGKCVLMDDCASLSALRKERPISIINTNFLILSICGSQGKIPKVCCRTEIAKTETDDVLHSSNPNLLPSTRECGVDLGKKIFGGHDVDLDEFPWLALLLYELPNGRQSFRCGGVLINDRYVLTAAHCLKENKRQQIWKLKSVRLGEYNKDSDEDCTSNGFNTVCLPIPPIDVNIEEEIINEKYDPKDKNLKHDIALLRLETKVSYTDYVRPICLPTLLEERKKTYNGMILTVAGWGQTENRSSSSVKLKVSIPVMKHSDCKALFSEARKVISDEQICAGGEEENKISCRGDSGGPLMSISVDENGDSNWYLAGIVSYGPVPCGVKDWPAVYTRVSKYMGWILKHMKP
ncbi:CLIP domain-containing serine protease 2-like isoform X1 [Harmonia axyridis]|uniref:CLIP domain-containing serine protease 2-like isoform X1 n=1 Tax=Harmonia axyridis TaxID=115357 RepID=UPI001E277937|nr:CLIP domain-containing serine protease 2-like isoform X1 [Harmonia axyridis]